VVRSRVLALSNCFKHLCQGGGEKRLLMRKRLFRRRPHLSVLSRSRPLTTARDHRRDRPETSLGKTIEVPTSEASAAGVRTGEVGTFVPPKTGDPEKQNPGAAGTATGAKQNSKWKSRQRNTRGNAVLQVVERHSFSLTHGHDIAGFIDQEGKSFAASAASGRCALGVFRSLKEACDAPGAACRGEQ
jgi:hypothetical protein